MSCVSDPCRMILARRTQCKETMLIATKEVEDENQDVSVRRV